MASKFQQRHYEALAQAIQDQKASYAGDGAELRQNVMQDFAEELAARFARDNGLFNRDRFLRACQIGANVRKRVA